MKRNLQSYKGFDLKAALRIFIKFSHAVLFVVLPLLLRAQQCNAPDAPELIVNGDFSSGSIGPADSQYLNQNYSNDGRYQISNNLQVPKMKEDFYGTGHLNSGNFMMINGSNNNNIRVWRTQVNNVIPGKIYYFSAWVCTLSPLSTEPGKRALLEFFINNVSAGNIFTAPAAYDVWTQIYVPWLADNTTATIILYNRNGSGGGNDFGLDDISFKASCEGLVGTGPKPELGPDISLCEAAMNIPIPSGIADATNLSYSWNTGANTPSINITQPGKYVLCVDSAGLGCYKSDTITVVNSPPVAPLIPGTSVCQFAAATPFPTNGLTDLLWYEQEVGGMGTPAPPQINTSVAGIQERFVSKLTGTCESERVKVQVEVIAAPTASLPDRLSICSGISAEVGQDPVAGFVYQWSNQTGLSTPHASRSDILLENLSNAPLESYYVLTITETLHACTSKDSTLVEVFPLPTATIDPVAAVCVNAPAFALQVNPAGGTLTGPFLSGNMFTPETAGNHLVNYVYQNAAGCSATITQTIVVTNRPVLAPITSIQVCQFATAVNIPNNSMYSLLWYDLPSGGLAATVPPPVNTDQPGTKELFVSALDGQCESERIRIEVKVIALPATSMPDRLSVCAGQTIEIGQDPENGYLYRWSSQVGLNAPQSSKTGLLLENNSSLPYDSMYVLTISEPVHYCSSKDSTLVTVRPMPAISFDPVLPLCVNAPSVLLSTAPAGGSLIGPHLSGNTFTPEMAGTFVLRYTFKDAGGCEGYSEQTILVHPRPNIQFENISAVCQGAAPLQLQASPAGGNFSGSYVQGTKFIPQTAGTFEVRYTYLTLEGCKDSVPRQILVFPAPIASIGAIPSVCEGAPAIQLKAFPEGGMYMGAHINGDTFLPATSGDFQVFYVYHDFNNCVDTASQSVNVKPEIIFPLNIGADKKICLQEETVLSAQGGNNYLWMPGATTEPQVTVKPEISTMFKVIVRNDVNCATGTDSVLVQVILPPKEILQDDTLFHCFNENTLTVAAADGETFRWEPGGTNSPSMEISEAGTYYLIAYNGDVCAKRDSVVVLESCGPSLFVPEAFSPNKDGNNDEFKVFGRFIKNFNLKIFNRWGEIIFEANHPKELWNGMFQGEQMPSGVYPWVIHYEAMDHVEKLKIAGSVVLAR